MDRAPAALGLQVPEGAVERIAGGPGGIAVCKTVAVETGGKPRFHGLDLRHHALHALAVAGIGDALAAAACLAVAQLCDHDHGFGLGPRLMAKEPAIGQFSAADGEG